MGWAMSCPNATAHTPCPRLYVRFFDWCREMSKTHGMGNCSKCGRQVRTTTEDWKAHRKACGPAFDREQLLALVDAQAQTITRMRPYLRHDSTGTLCCAEQYRDWQCRCGLAALLRKIAGGGCDVR
jgi:hypothetical protein